MVMIVASGCVRTIHLVHIDRMAIDDRLLLYDDARLLHVDGLLGSGGVGLCRHLTGEGRLLERGDEGIANTLLVEGNDVADLQAALDSLRLQMREDDRFADATAAHVDHIRHRDAAVYDRLLLDVSLLLLSVILLLLIRPLPLDCIVLGSADESAGYGADSSTEEHSLGGLVILLADNAANPRACDATEGCPVLRSRRLAPPELRVGNNNSDC